MLRIDLEPPATIDLDGVTGLIVTSGNALEALAGSPALASALPLPIHAVGPATAARARMLGFTNVIEGPGSARELVVEIGRTVKPGDGALLHLCGDRVAFDLAGALALSGIRARTQQVYRSIPTYRLSGGLVRTLQSGGVDAVLLMSPRTAEVYVRLVAEAGLAEKCRALTYICISQAVAARLAPLAPPSVAVAVRPNSEEMLALVARLAAQLA